MQESRSIGCNVGNWINFILCGEFWRIWTVCSSKFISAWRISERQIVLNRSVNYLLLIIIRRYARLNDYNCFTSSSFNFYPSFAVWRRCIKGSTILATSGLKSNEASIDTTFSKVEFSAAFEIASSLIVYSIITDIALSNLWSYRGFFTIYGNGDVLLSRSFRLFKD